MHWWTHWAALQNMHWSALQSALVNTGNLIYVFEPAVISTGALSNHVNENYTYALLGISEHWPALSRNALASTFFTRVGLVATIAIGWKLGAFFSPRNWLVSRELSRVHRRMTAFDNTSICNNPGRSWQTQQCGNTRCRTWESMYMYLYEIRTIQWTVYIHTRSFQPRNYIYISESGYH